LSTGLRTIQKNQGTSKEDVVERYQEGCEEQIRSATGGFAFSEKMEKEN